MNVRPGWSVLRSLRALFPLQAINNVNSSAHDDYILRRVSVSYNAVISIQTFFFLQAYIALYEGGSPQNFSGSCIQWLPSFLPASLNCVLSAVAMKTVRLLGCNTVQSGGKLRVGRPYAFFFMVEE